MCAQSFSVTGSINIEVGTPVNYTATFTPNPNGTLLVEKPVQNTAHFSYIWQNNSAKGVYYIQFVSQEGTFIQPIVKL